MCVCVCLIEPATFRLIAQCPNQQLPTCPSQFGVIDDNINIYVYIYIYIYTYIFFTELIENADVVRFIKSRRIIWPGHVMMRMDCKRTPNSVLEWKTIGARIRGRPRKRWIVDMEEDIQIMGIRWWRKQCKERTEWKRITEKAKTHSGL